MPLRSGPSRQVANSYPSRPAWGRARGGGDMLISESEFEASTRQNLNWPEDQDLPANLARKIKKYFQDMDKDRNEVIDFEEYFDWSMKHRWSE
ncbi:unnamed protein product, partial [Symbiodinium sp. KB8]